MLKMQQFQVKDVLQGSETSYAKGILTVNLNELQQMLMAGTDQFESVQVALAKPGDKCRVIRIIDAVEPRSKPVNDGTPFPGFTGPANEAGSGVTSRLANTAIITCGSFPEYGPDSHMGTNECIVDMSGLGAAFSPFAKTFNIVLSLQRSKIATTAGFVSAMRMASFQASEYLAKAVKDSQPDAETTYDLGDTSTLSGLPRVGVVLLLSSLGTMSLPLREFFVYGHSVDGMLPFVLHPNEVLDGAVVGSYSVYGAIKNPTYFYQNNPIIEELYREHGKTVNFVAAIVSRAGDVTDAGKFNKAARIGSLARLLDLDGAIISPNAGGHHVVDYMLACQQLERAGVKAVAICAEMAGPDGSDNPFPFVVPEANSLVSTGNMEASSILPPMDTVIGGERLLDGQVAAGELVAPFRHIFCSMSLVGGWNLTAKPF